MKPDRFLSLLLLICVMGIPGIHKLCGDFPPAWFVGKFGPSLIGQVPAGIFAGYLVITVLELGAAALFVAGLVLSFGKHGIAPKAVHAGFDTTLAVFVVLVFGSFLVEDYNNGFMDCLYFVGVVVLKRAYFGEK